MSALLDDKEEMNEQKDRKQIRKKSKNNRVCLSIFAFVMLLLYRFLFMRRKQKVMGIQLR